jgi:hypothetical protein
MANDQLKQTGSEARRRCVDCKKTFPIAELIRGPHPHDSDIHNDPTPVYLCPPCHQAAGDDV